MKKVILAIGFIALLSACTSTTEEATTNTDSVMTDTVVMASPVMGMDSMPDSLKTEIDSIAQ